MEVFTRATINDTNIVEAIHFCNLNDDMHMFYLGKAWRRLRKEVLQECNGECQHCKAKGYYTKARDVHHVKHVKQYPELALSKFYMDENGQQQRQLVPLCDGCHCTVHNRNKVEHKEPITVERWD